MLLALQCLDCKCTLPTELSPWPEKDLLKQQMHRNPASWGPRGRKFLLLRDKFSQGVALRKCSRTRFGRQSEVPVLTGSPFFRECHLFPLALTLEPKNCPASNLYSWVALGALELSASLKRLWISISVCGWKTETRRPANLDKEMSLTHIHGRCRP